MIYGYYNFTALTAGMKQLALTEFIAMRGIGRNIDML